MKKIYIFLLLSSLIAISIDAQNTDFNNISKMSWGLDYKIYLQMANDSTYSYDIRQLFHVSDPQNFTTDYVYYPVNLGKNYLQDISDIDTVSNVNKTYKTLWSALHANLGGGWINFTNCLMYALETNSLDLKAPLMKRPETKWKPHPVTKTYKRTHKWKYYIPVSQKLAKKEYNIRKSNNELGDIKSIPEEYVNLFLDTKEKNYDALKEKGQSKTTAKIDLVKLLLGTKYLGEAQITYISSTVLKAVKNYNINQLPSVIVFDKFDAAAIMTLDQDGYKVGNIVFNSSANLDEETRQERRKEIVQIIDNINNYNKNSFQKRLGNYYKQ